MGGGDDRADDGHEDQGRNQGSAHHHDHDDRQVAHELADNARPEQQRHEGAQRREGG
ncbi:hypothetical protein D3C72_2591320 [compost metagenome]